MASARNVAAIVEDRHVRAERLRGLSGQPIVFLKGETRGLLAILLFERVEPVGLHEFQAPTGAGLILAYDIEENAVTIRKKTHRLADLLAEIVEIRAVKIHHMKARLQRALRPTSVATILIHLAPFGVFIGGEVVHASREIDRRVDASFLRGVVLFAEKIEAQMRMDFPNRRRVVAPTMVTL